jgi:GT2 family glycosyltransferase
MINYDYGTPLSLVIVNYCSAEMTIVCVNSIAAYDIAEQQNIFVVDSASPDLSVVRVLGQAVA